MSFLTPVEGTPGWFDDPTTPGVTRYWDGHRWTERSFGAPLPPAPAPGQGPVAAPGPRPVVTRPGAPIDKGAIRALVLALIGCFWGIPAIIEGGKARRRIRYSGGHLGGDGLALAAVIIGWVWVGLGVLSVGLFILGANTSSDTTFTPVTTYAN